MKTIIQENHYQKRNWEDACFERDLKSGKLDDLLGDEADFVNRRAASLEEMKRKYSEYEKTTQTFPSLIGRFKFKLASRYAVSLARHYEMNVHVQASDSQGIIELSCEEIIFDTVWKDGKLKRYFLLLFLFANSVCVENKNQSGSIILSIWLSYYLEYQFHMRLPVKELHRHK